MRLAAWAMVLFLTAFAATPIAAQSGGPRSVREGVFSPTQADRGEVTYREVCANCHTLSQFRGEAFELAWAGRTVRDLFRLIRSSMPNDNPGALTDQQYIDVVAYLLKLNRYPTGETELAADENVLRRIRIEQVEAR